MTAAQLQNVVIAFVKSAGYTSLQCFDTVGWLAGRASGL